MREKISKLVSAIILAGALFAQNSEAVDLSQYTPLEKQLIKHEGFKNQRYYDTGGIPHVGVGFNLKRYDAKQKISSVGADYDKVLKGEQKLDDKQITFLFRQDLSNATCNAKVIIKDYDSQPAKVKNVVVDMIYNVGPAKFKEFKRTINCIEEHNYKGAALRMKRSPWYRQTGYRAKELVGLMATAEYVPSSFSK